MAARATRGCAPGSAPGYPPGYAPATSPRVGRHALTGLIFLALLPTACVEQRPPAPIWQPPAVIVPPPTVRDDLIAVGGSFFPIGTRVVRWDQPGGLNGYLTGAYEPRTDSAGRAIGANLAAVQRCVDQFVYHYDGSGTSHRCFRTLGDRHLSVHFLLDLDGTIYQALDVKEKAWHATIANNRSVGVEIANAGAFPVGYPDLISRWYRRDAAGHLLLASPGESSLAGEGIATPFFVGRPARDQPVTGLIQGIPQRQYDYTPQQYEALARLTAALCRCLPQIRCDYPRDERGRLATYKLPNSYLAQYTGLLGHYHIQAEKIDPGPAFQWDYVVIRAREYMAGGSGY